MTLLPRAVLKLLDPQRRDGTGTGHNADPGPGPADLDDDIPY